MNISIEVAKNSFFSADAVLKALGKAEVRVFKRQGSYVRKIAQNSMRRRKRKSRPGEPPSVRTGLLKRHIYYVWSDIERTMIVGPAAFAKTSGAPSALEHGGTSQIKQGDKRIVAEIEPRPYMGPALSKSLPAFPGMWADSIAKTR